MVIEIDPSIRCDKTETCLEGYFRTRSYETTSDTDKLRILPSLNRSVLGAISEPLSGIRTVYHIIRYSVLIQQACMMEAGIKTAS